MPPNTPGFVPGLGVQKPSQIPYITPTPDVPVSYPTGMFAQLVRQPYRATSVSYGLLYPVIVGALVSSPLVAPTHVHVSGGPLQARQTHSVLRPPSVVGLGVVFSPIRTKSVRTPRTRTVSALFPASVVSPPALAQQVRVDVAQTPRSRFSFWSRLSPPPKILAVTQPLARPPVVETTRTPLARFRTVRRLAPPTVVGTSSPPVVTVVRSSISWRLHPFRKTISVLGAPVTVGAPALIVARIAKFLAAQPTQTRHVGRFGVAPPQIVNVLPAQITLQIRLAAQSRLGRRPLYRIARPSVLTAPKPSSEQTRLRVSYTRSHRISRGPHNINLRPPTVVGAFVPPPPPPVPPPTWSPFIDGPQQKHSYTAPELWYGDKPPPRRKR